jgi:hypothetical protein
VTARAYEGESPERLRRALAGAKIAVTENERTDLLIALPEAYERSWFEKPTA